MLLFKPVCCGRLPGEGAVQGRLADHPRPIC
jgi:hypothetical protein